MTVREPIENLNEFAPEEKIEIEASDILNNLEENRLEEDRWEDTEEGMRYHGLDYDPVCDEWI